MRFVGRVLLLTFGLCPACGASNISVGSAPVQCASAYHACYESKCCIDANHGCYKRQGRQYAQCRPIPPHGCVDYDDWECPGWENCAEDHGTCTTSRCCKSTSFACFRRPNQAYAQCRPQVDPTQCVDTEQWRCPGWELCSDDFASCTDTLCCASVASTCYKKRDRYSQCLRTGTCEAGRDGLCEPERVRRTRHASRHLLSVLMHADAYLCNTELRRALWDSAATRIVTATKLRAAREEKTTAT